METTNNANAENTAASADNKVNKVPRLPSKEEDLKNLAQRVLEKWKTDKMELRYRSIANFEKDVQSFVQTLAERGEKGDKRKPISQQLKDLDAEINSHIEDIKAYIKSEKGAKQADAFYPQFGIEKASKGYKFPSDRDARLKSLKKLLQALDEHGLNNKTYGKTYWEDIATKYESLQTQAVQSDSDISGKVREKNNARDEIRKTLNCLLKLIEGHYPDDYAAVWREWGFQRGRY